MLELPLQTFPQLGDQIWGIVLPTRPDGSQPVLLSLSSEQGPVTVFSAEAKPIASLVPGGEAVEIEGLPIRIDNVLAASGILLKRDPGVPLVDQVLDGGPGGGDVVDRQRVDAQLAHLGGALLERHHSVPELLPGCSQQTQQRAAQGRWQCAGGGVRPALAQHCGCVGQSGCAAGCCGGGGG